MCFVPTEFVDFLTKGNFGALFEDFEPSAIYIVPFWSKEPQLQYHAMIEKE
jgi:hypothetical protein